VEFLAELALFALKSLLIVGSILVVAAFLFQMGARPGRRVPQIEVEKLNTRYRSFRRMLQSSLLGKKQFKKVLKDEKKADKQEDGAKPGRVFVLDFDGDIRATQVERMREEITAILSVSASDDEVVLRLESGGGLVTSYGLAASQLARIKKQGVKLTVCVDKVAASGGYMMACVADKILAAPFSVIGSIGVIAQVPNFNKLLKKHDVDYREVTAGEFKRTVTVFGEITQPGLEKFKEQIEETHALFKNFVKQHRPTIDLQKVATGEHWYGTDAKGLGLVDDITTSDEYLTLRATSADIFRIQFLGRRKLIERLTESAATALRQALMKVVSDTENRRFGL
jgi:serine protease SohB